MFEKEENRITGLTYEEARGYLHPTKHRFLTKCIKRATWTDQNGFSLEIRNPGTWIKTWELVKREPLLQALMGDCYEFITPLSIVLVSKENHIIYSIPVDTVWKPSKEDMRMNDWMAISH